MKNVSNPYGYYLTENFETIELRGNFEKNNLLLPTKNPDEQLNYKVFVSPKKAINFAIQIVGGTNPEVVYIPQHIYKDLQIAYSENNPYYTIKDITIIKLDFTNSGNGLVKYLKTKFETTKGTELSKIGNAGSTGIKNYAGFDGAGNPIDEDILKQILYLFEEQNDIIFVDKNVQLVTEDIVKSSGSKSNRILGDFTFISNYFDSSGKFKESLLNSKENIKIEDTTIKSILQLPDFLKDTTDKTLTDVNSIYKNNITIETAINKAPKIVGQVIGGLAIATPLIKMGLDKLSELKKQKALKQAEEAKSLAKKGLANLENAGGNVVGMIEDGIGGAKDKAKDAYSNVVSIFKKPVIPQMSIKVPKIAIVKPKFNKFKIKAMGESLQSAANTIQSTANSVQSGVSNAVSLANSAKSNVSNTISLAKSAQSAAQSAISSAKSITTISTIGNVSIGEGLNMIKNAAGQTTETLKAANKDFLKGN
jgi:hypothetical protein